MRVSVGDFCNAPEAMLDRMSSEQDRMILHKGDADCAVVLSMKEFQYYRQLEDEADLRLIQQQKGGTVESVSWDEIKADLDLGE